MKIIYTIGYAPHTIDTFVNVLNRYHISALVDVRSSPYSQYKPEFNREPLKNCLKVHNIVYVFLGDYVGARVKDPACYVNGKVDYSLVAQSDNFIYGLDKIKKGLGKYNIAIMCAETDPITCHRTILICRNLRSAGINIKHILGDTETEDHKDSELRLLKLFKLHHPDLFRTEEQRLEDAYSRQGNIIAYEAAEEINEYWS